MTYVNRWSMSSVWVGAMLVGGATLVPNVLSFSSWIGTTLVGAVLLVGAGAYWDTSRPVPSLRQTRATAEGPVPAPTGKRP